MASIELSDRYNNLVNDSIRPHFAERGIEMTDRAQQLFAFTMQSQVDEKEMSDERLSTITQVLVSNNLAEYYVWRYGHRTMNFSRTFHLLAEIGPFAKFPFGPTRPYSR